MNKEDFLTQLYLSSVQLYRLNGDIPVDSASGCLIDYHGHRILLTVEHATGDQGNWAIQLKYDPEKKGAQLYNLGVMNFLKRGSIFSRETEIIDFSYVEVQNDLIAYRQKIQEDGQIIEEWPITVYSPDFSLDPNIEEEYGFSCLTKPEYENHPHITVLSSELKVIHGLKYLRMDRDRYVFKLPFEHPGHMEFKGCSGAPIIDSFGRPIALVTGGCTSKDEICGISLKQYQTPIDVLVGIVI